MIIQYYVQIQMCFNSKNTNTSRTTQTTVCNATGNTLCVAEGHCQEGECIQENVPLQKGVRSQSKSFTRFWRDGTCGWKPIDFEDKHENVLHGRASNVRERGGKYDVMCPTCNNLSHVWQPPTVVPPSVLHDAFACCHFYLGCVYMSS